MTTDTDVRLLKPKEAAELLGISEKTLRKDRSLHHLKIPFLRIGGRIRYPLSALPEWINTRMVHVETPPRRGRPPKALQLARLHTSKKRVAVTE